MLGCSECILRIPNKLFNGPKTIRSVGYVDWDGRWKDFSFHLELPDLSMEFVNVRFNAFSGFLAFIKYIGSSFEQGSLPIADHRWVDSETMGHSSAVVSSFFKAPRATLALNAGPYFFLCLLMSAPFIFRLTQSLTYCPKFWGEGLFTD